MGAATHRLSPWRSRRLWLSLAVALLLSAVTHVSTLRAGQVPDRAPADAWAEQLEGELATQASYDQRFPLHGVAFHMLAQVVSEPNDHAEVIGYMRRGARFRASQGRSGPGCERSWHELASGGYVCAGRGFSLGAQPQSSDAAPAPPELSDSLPYRYAKNTAKSSMQYWRIPTREEEALAQKLLTSAPAPSLRALETAPDAGASAELKLPDFARMPMEPGFYVSVDHSERDGGREFVRTVRGAFVIAAALTDVSITHAPGAVLNGGDLPLGITYRGTTKVLKADPLGGPPRQTSTLPRFSAVSLSQTGVQQQGRSFALTHAGELLAESALRIASRVQRPSLVPRRARWIHVNLAQQTLVAYDGDRPVFATLVSTGKEGYETPTGVFRIYAKHVSATMDGMAGNDEAYSIEDVPWTMYFQGSYALHAAFWHDHFGNVRSHGCVNLAPADARWLFRWSSPSLPTGWHGVVATRDNPGTFIFID